MENANLTDQVKDLEEIEALQKMYRQLKRQTEQR